MIAVFPAYTSPEDFWHESNLAVNDWAGVTKLQISTMFGKDFLVPFERLDDMFSLHIQVSVRCYAFASGSLHQLYHVLTAMACSFPHGVPSMSIWASTSP